MHLCSINLLQRMLVHFAGFRMCMLQLSLLFDEVNRRCMCGGLCGYEMNEISEPLCLAEVIAEKRV